MLTDGEICDNLGGVFKSVAEAAWASQSQHERFLFKKARPKDHPSRAVWASANNLLIAEGRARKTGRVAVI